MVDNRFKPYISSDKKIKELTVTSIVLGIILAVVFGGANAYLGLRVGMTVSASIPAAVISMGVIRLILRKESVLENNIVQTIGSAGESVAAGAIFTLPVLFMWADEIGENPPKFFTITLIALIGSILGIAFMVPLRRALIVKEHGVLPYPEGTACAEVLLAGEKKGNSAVLVFVGLAVSAIYKFICDGLKIFPSEIHYEGSRYKGSAIGIDVLPALVGVGYICGPKIASYMLGGGILAWFVLMPLIALFGADVVMFPSDIAINSMDTFAVWNKYIRYIGAGAVAAAGIISLVKSLPTIAEAFAKSIKGFGKNETDNSRTNRDISMIAIYAIIVIVALLMWIIDAIPINIIGALIIIIFGFFFATVSSRMVGLVGSSNNPVSGMAIATLLVATILLKISGNTGYGGMVAAITIGSIICIIAAVAGDTSQDLKTGYILGATPRLQQYGELIGVVIASLTIGGVLYLLNRAWGYGTNELPAPQATLMKMVVEGVMDGNLPWNLIFIGAFIAIIIEILGIPALPFAVGLYLPIHLSTGIMSGGLIRLFFDKRKDSNKERKKSMIDRGVLYTSGMIAGEGLIGIMLAVFAIVKFKGKTIGNWINIGDVINFGNVGGLVAFIILIITVIFFIVRGSKNND